MLFIYSLPSLISHSAEIFYPFLFLLLQVGNRNISVHITDSMFKHPPSSKFPVPDLFPCRTYHEVCENNNPLISHASLDREHKLGMQETEQHQSPSGLRLAPIRESHGSSSSSPDYVFQSSSLPADRPALSEQPNLELSIAAPRPLDQSKPSPTSLLIGSIRVVWWSIWFSTWWAHKHQEIDGSFECIRHSIPWTGDRFCHIWSNVSDINQLPIAIVLILFPK